MIYYQYSGESRGYASAKEEGEKVIKRSLSDSLFLFSQLQNDWLISSGYFAYPLILSV